VEGAYVILMGALFGGFGINEQNLVAPIDGQQFSVHVIDANTFSLNNSDLTNVASYQSGGEILSVTSYPVLTSAMTLSILVKAKNLLGIEGASKADPILTELIQDAMGWILQQIGRKALLTQEYVETRQGEGYRSFTPFNLPVTSLISVTIDNQVVPPRGMPGVPGYLLVNDRIGVDDYATGNPFPGDYSPYYVDGSRWRFTRGFANIVTRYIAGYSLGAAVPGVAPMPIEIPRAVADLACYWYKGREHIGIRSRTIGGGQGGELVTFLFDSMPSSVKDTVNQYRVPYFP
jgi:hypothetical protein